MSNSSPCPVRPRFPCVTPSGVDLPSVPRPWGRPSTQSRLSALTQTHRRTLSDPTLGARHALVSTDTHRVDTRTHRVSGWERDRGPGSGTRGPGEGR